MNNSSATEFQPQETELRPLLSYLDDFEGLSALHQIDIYSRSKEEVAEFRLAILQKRFNELKDDLVALKKLAGIKGVSEINELDDAAPILFQHKVYKSYPMSFLEQGRFDDLTKWFDQLTTHDLSKLDASDCKLVEDWFQLIDNATPVKPNHTTGTSGRLSFLPRSEREWRLQARLLLGNYQGVHGEPGISFDIDNPGFQVAIIQPSYRYGYYMANRTMKEQIEIIGDPDKVECLYGDEVLSPDVLSLSGRVASADEKGELDNLVIEPAVMEKFKSSMANAISYQQKSAIFFDSILERYKGQQVMMGNTIPNLFNMAKEAKANGVANLFASNSMITTGGGFKGQDIPADWREQVEEVLGAPVTLAYGMSELCSAAIMCRQGHYHVPPYLIIYLLDEDTNEPLPRRGEQTGRAAMFDAVPDSYWGGLITGDELTINWDGGCACGRTGEYILPNIRRFSDKTGSDDKISCSGAADTQARAQAYLADLMAEEAAMTA